MEVNEVWPCILISKISHVVAVVPLLDYIWCIYQCVCSVIVNDPHLGDVSTRVVIDAAVLLDYAIVLTRLLSLPPEAAFLRSSLVRTALSPQGLCYDIL